MPIRAPATVQEMRITLGRKEYEQLKNFEETQRKNVWLDAIPNIGIAAIGGGAFLAGYAFLSWAGLSVKEIIDGAIETTKEAVDKSSSWLSDYIIEEDFMNPINPDEVSVWKRIEWIENRILEIHARQAEIYDFIHGDPTPPMTQIQQVIREGSTLAVEEAQLRDELNKITTGELTIHDHYPAS